MTSIQLQPKASSLIESLRDIGYSFESAVADIIDNSITANANEIRIFFDFIDNRFILAIVDNGIGMKKEELIEAMRTGGKNPLESREKEDLGRFGLGLKTASFSQCRRLTVVSSQQKIKNATRWDLDFVAKEDSWSLQILNSDEINSLYKIKELGRNGTLVLWEECDRVIDTSLKKLTEDSIYEKIEHLQKHLELVFHRYLKGKKHIDIFINGTKLEPFDPFFTSHLATQELSEETVILNGEKIKIKPYILPHYTKVSAKDYEYYGGVGGYLKNQGFYVYRNRRLLISGTWFRIIPQSEMYKLARIQIDLPNNLDNLWQIDVKKSMASPPLVIRHRLKKIIDKIAGSSTRVYKARGYRNSSTTTAFWERFSARGEIKYSINNKHPLIQNFLSSLNSNQKKEFFELLKLIADFFPKEMLYSDLGNNPKELKSEDNILDGELEEKAIFLYHSGLINDIETLKFIEPFNKYTKDWKLFFENNI